MSGIPQPIRHDFEHGKKLEWWTIFWTGTVIVVMYFTMGASQAMQSALIEDFLSLIPAITWLVAARFEPRAPTEKYPYGFVRVNSLAFLVSAVALALVGTFVFYESASTLLMGEHPTVPPVSIFGQDIWLGWLMIAALVYSIFPPVILGHKKQPVAQRLRDKVLHTDALMQKADWQTGLAGILGIVGIGLGYWWADSAAALFIAVSILKDGIDNVRIASAELLDGAPRQLEGSDISGEAMRLEKRLLDLWPDCDVRIRESGRYLFASVEGMATPDQLPPAKELMGGDPAWRLGRLTFSPDKKDEPAGAS
ncbi:cation diffusion facilitator family transporter [Qipengyuania sp. RANM35]|uniref:cation diffusion facilitator family transporter n=1 Tax=Qipengyuania sp. RANM35 TaxID=3068635 RepID=UPI0034DB2402